MLKTGLTLLFCLPAVLAAATLELFVAPNGTDDGDGSARRPFVTLERARDEIRARKGKAAGPVTVQIRGGQYRLKQTFRLDAKDSGTAAAPIVYSAYRGEQPVFSGGVRLTGFQTVADPALLARLPAEARGKVVQSDLRAQGVARLPALTMGGFGSGRGFRTHPVAELFFNGQPLLLARWPNEGFVETGEILGATPVDSHGKHGCREGVFLFADERMLRWKDERDPWLYGYWFWDWADSYEKVESFDTGKREIRLVPPYHSYGYAKGKRFQALNLFSEIDRPGEWYLDRERCVLYLWPPSDPGRATVEMSLANFPFVELQNVEHVSLRGLAWELGQANAVELHDASHCALEGCSVRRFGGDGVIVQGGRDDRIVSCDVFSMGRGGIQVHGGDRKTLAPAGHRVENCHIHDLSRMDHTYTPGVVVDGVGNVVAHNLIHDIASSAIRLGGNEHTVELNEICRVVMESDDQGAVDMWGNPTFRGNVYRNNYFHHIGNWDRHRGEMPCGEAGIRLDDAISGIRIVGNIFYRSSGGKFGGVQIHGGKDNRVENNLFAECAIAVSFSPWDEKRWHAFTSNALDSAQIDRTLYLQRYPELARLQDDVNVNTVRGNIVYGSRDVFRNNKAAVATNNLVYTNAPVFVSSRAGGFNVRTGDAKLTAIGFPPIPFDKIGLHQDEFRRKLPEALIRDMRAR